MASLKIDNLVSSMDSLFNQNVVSCSNNIKDYYIHSSVYQKALNSNKSELISLSKDILNDVTSSANELTQLNTYLHRYIDDYIAVKQYLTEGSQSEVTSIPTFNLLKSSLSLKEDNLNAISLINLKLVMDYEKVFKEKDDKNNE